MGKRKSQEMCGYTKISTGISQMNTNNLKRMVELTVQLHQLIKDGKDESDEGEKIREEMDRYDDSSISEENWEWLAQFSESLYKLWENTGD